MIDMIALPPLVFSELDPRMQRAIEELKRTISARYPSTVYRLERSRDNPYGVHLMAVTDAGDPDDVGDLVVDRVVELIAEEGIPVHVIPLRAPERRRAAIAADRQGE